MLQPLHQHLGVAHLAQQPGVPAGLVPQSLYPVGVEQRPERAQVGPEPAGADPGLVDVLRIVAEADAGIVSHDAGQGVACGRLHDLPHSGVGADGRDRPGERLEGAGAERPHDLGSLVGGAGTGVAEAFDHRRQQPVGRIVLDLDLQFPEA